MKLSKRCKLTV